MDLYAPGQLNSVETARRLIGHWTGFELRPSAPQRIYALLEGRRAALNFTTIDDYLNALSNLSSTDEEPQRLINLITNGLTAFWRDDVQLEALRSIMRDASTKQRPLQIWCAGCSTGEEPFTVAMLAREAGIDARILGTDINTDFLNHARQGIYGPWSLRRLSSERRHRFFTQNDARSWKINPELQSFVTFQHHNLLSPLSYAAEPFENRKWDIILCRNVLIYLTAEATEKVYYNFSHALAPDGYLLLSSSEQINNDLSTYDSSPIKAGSAIPRACFQSTRSGESFVYRLCSHSQKWTSSQHHSPQQPNKTKTGLFSTPYNQPQYSSHTQYFTHDDIDHGEAPPPLIPTETCDLHEVTCEIEDTHTVMNLLITAAQYLQRSQYDEAITTFEAVISYDPFIPEAYCLIGKALYESGAHQLAGEAFRKALFLEPHNWFAASQMADLMIRFDSPDAARQAWRQTLEGLNADPEPLAEAHILLQFIKPLAEYREHIRKLANAYLQNDV